MDLLDKIITLFEYRALPTLIKQGGADSGEKEELLALLYKLQENIYQLDQVLETQYAIDNDLLSEKWKAIYQSLSDCGIPIDQHSDYCRQIYRYQKHELSQREGKSLLRFDMEYFYYFKSCDVKLMRRIIYERYPHLNNLYKLRDWRYFDLLTELNDDIEDVYEDYGTNNGNRFLLEIEAYGIEKATDNFALFMDSITQKYKEKIDTYPVDSLLYTLSHKELVATKSLLDQRNKEIKASDLAMLAGVENYL